MNGYNTISFEIFEVFVQNCAILYLLQMCYPGFKYQERFNPFVPNAPFL